MDNDYNKGFKSANLTIVMDSTFRDMNDWPKVEYFAYGNKITSSWPKYKSSASTKRKYNMRIIDIVIPYRAELLTEKYYMASISHTDDPMRKKLLNGSSTPGYNKSNFILSVDRVIGTSWIYLRSMTSSVPTTLDLGGGEFHFQIYDALGDPLVINSVEDATLKENQVTAIFELSPSS